MLLKWSVQVRPPARALSYAPTFIGQWWRLAQEKKNGATENASTENESTGGWNMQVRNT